VSTAANANRRAAGLVGWHDRLKQAKICVNPEIICVNPEILISKPVTTPVPTR
jgi:hypothetical protein